MRISKCYGFLQKDIVADVDVDKVTSKPTAYIDIKSDGLRGILRTVLKHIKWIGLGGDKLSVYAFVHDQSKIFSG
jgi:hypothetical protein